ncbi:hypothetical protein RYZ26_19665 [Terasakiella sp. A23]|uniref:hypothetical protein n=1 Tax=Terasakiella sp. FCG-A23 TaxID=3080561 RepID=UPI002953C79D|nr:hypothetical protein [Terasakiella sp. A23]MDV7341823.1 hypothetical protein [Terasakiella sp. A23]
MSGQQEFKTISFDDKEAIVEAIKEHQSFEIGACQKRMSEAILFVERTIGAEGMTSRVYTKGRAAAILLPHIVSVATATAIAAHNLITLNPDYEVLKRPINGVLRLIYVKDDPTLKDRAANTYEKAKSRTAQTLDAFANACHNLSEGLKTSSKENVSAEGNVSEHTQAANILTLQNHLAKAREVFEEQNKTNEFIVCLYAVGVSIASCDGNFDDDEKDALKKHILGLSAVKLPTKIENALNQITQHQPTFDEAMIYVEKLGPSSWPVIDDLLTAISGADGYVSEEETTYLAQWEEFKKESEKSNVA